MTPGEWAKVEAGLDELLALPQSARSAGLRRIAGEDAQMRRELESLLARVEAEDPLLDRPPFAFVESGCLAPGTRIGAYRLVTLIGRGGMGEVYRAERADGQYEQEVALKLIRREIADQSARFQSERQTLARLDHPGIARLLDGGVAQDGRPYMVMELVVGSDVVSWCNQCSSSLDERLLVFTAICSALEYAHRNLVVHRDLKPANVVVTAEGTVKVLDFGIAKLLGAPGGMAPTEHAPMTPAYAAPEQLVQGSITTATDVYALGTLLFELLTGVGPWNFRELSLAAGIEKVLREPAPLMSNVAGVQGRPPVPPKLLRGDLDAIVAKALRKEPERRYTTVAALREDIERTQRHEPVAARGGARLYAMGLFFRRYRLLVASTTLAILALVAGTATTMWQAHSARMEARRADAVRDFLLDIFRHNSTENPDGAHARQTTAEQLLDIGADRIRTGLTTEPRLRGQMMDVLADLYDQLEKFDKVAELERLRLAEIKRVGDSPSADEAGAQWLLGRALTMQGDYPAAYDMLKAALGTMDSIREKASARRAEALLETGRLAYHQATPDSLQAANRYAVESFEVYEKSDPGNPDKLFALQLEARVAERQGRLAEAERLYRQFVSQSAQFPAIPALSAHGYDDLGSLLLDERRYREAEPQLRRAIEIYSKSEGDKQFDTATDRAYLGELLIATNRGSEGDALLREALADLEQTQGADNLPTTAVVRLRFARSELRRGNLSLAEQLLRRNIAAFEAKNPLDHNYFPETLRTDAELKMSQGRFEEAGTELERSDALWPSSDSANDGLRHGINRVLEARLALEQGRYDQGVRASLERVRSLWPATERELPAVYVLATLGLAEGALSQRRSDVAAELAQQLLGRLLREPEHESLADWEARTRLLLGKALGQEGRANEAKAQLEWAIRLREQFDHPQSPWLAEARVALTSCCGSR